MLLHLGEGGLVPLGPEAGDLVGPADGGLLLLTEEGALLPAVAVQEVDLLPGEA
ncbi:MAG: hypothetical protein QF787_14020 [Nitrospinota bacterium]|jgi:hypothetical protein|nr:hypothetical protein [Nitrospinota bacterium]